ncbi:response regulator [Streptomyces sp. NPDC059076]|uniref:response regulator transcription factor n=1 Tax=unclassified Streptomyces TaxID=2593676 RepID=UPI0036C5C48F
MTEESIGGTPMGPWPGTGADRAGGATAPDDSVRSRPDGIEPTTSAPARVVVADDQTVVREGIVMLLGLLPGIEVVGTAKDGAEAVALVAELAPDVVLMDLRMPRCDGVEATRRIREAHPGTQVVVLTTYADDASLFPALRAGARGYLTKDADGDEIARAVRDVIEGRAWLTPVVQRRLLEQFTAGQAPAAPRLPDGLTSREGEVLALIADGLTNGEIARRLHISNATVKTHINNLFAKADLHDRAQAVRYAYREGLAQPPGSRVT